MIDKGRASKEPAHADELRRRACELGAEILVTHTWTVVGRRGPAQVTKEALLVRFEPELR